MPKVNEWIASIQPPGAMKMGPLRSVSMVFVSMVFVPCIRLQPCQLVTRIMMSTNLQPLELRHVHTAAVAGARMLLRPICFCDSLGRQAWYVAARDRVHPFTCIDTSLSTGLLTTQAGAIIGTTTKTSCLPALQQPWTLGPRCGPGELIISQL